LRSKNLKVNIGMNKLFVQVIGQDPIIDGEFPEKINSEDSLWTLESNKEGKVIHFSITKWRDQNSWWASAIKGDPEINT